MIKLTQPAVEKIKRSLAKRGKGSGIHVGVKTTGCSGLAYVLEYKDNNKFDPWEDRLVYPEFVVTVNIKDKPYLKGMTIDYVKEGLNEGFKFTNPNERDRCGCGESFRV